MFIIYFVGFATSEGWSGISTRRTPKTNKRSGNEWKEEWELHVRFCERRGYSKEWIFQHDK